MSAITPTAHGDAKTGQNSYLLQPVSVEDLHNTRSARNFWVRINGNDPGLPLATARNWRPPPVWIKTLDPDCRLALANRSAYRRP
jgi:hypothetical protein